MHKNGWNCIEKSKYLLGKLKVLHKKIIMKCREQIMIISADFQTIKANAKVSKQKNTQRVADSTLTGYTCGYE